MGILAWVKRIWQAFIGYEIAQRRERRLELETAAEAFQELYREMRSEVDSLRKQLVEERLECDKKINALQRQLNVAMRRIAELERKGN